MSLGYKQAVRQVDLLNKQQDILMQKLVILATRPDSAQAKEIRDKIVALLPKQPEPKKERWYRRMFKWYGQRENTVQDTKPALSL